jgi:hypothetical protein
MADETPDDAVVDGLLERMEGIQDLIDAVRRADFALVIYREDGTTFYDGVGDLSADDILAIRRCCDEIEAIYMGEIDIEVELEGDDDD